MSEMEQRNMNGEARRTVSEETWMSSNEEGQANENREGWKIVDGKTPVDVCRRAERGRNEGRYYYEYPRPAVTADCVVFGGGAKELKVLLVERDREPYRGMWALPGGFMEMTETAEECALRELEEETGLRLKGVQQLGAFSGVDRDPRGRVVSVAFYAETRLSEVRGGDDASRARWVDVESVPKLAFDHDRILREALRRVGQERRIGRILGQKGTFKGI